jgi:predicted O-linked N-acetylglucosamine transferase (SPINDLY family)
MGYPATTGLEAIDYRLTDAVADPPGIADEFYTEKLWRLDGVLVCYEAPADMPEPGQLPALGQGTMTFGSFNSVNKLGPAVISNWARILKALPGSRLVLTSVPRGHAQERLAAMFEAEGVDSARLKMVPEMANAEFLQLYREVDIALDSFPCGGGTSTCESLWMGVPVVSLLGKTFAGRVSASMLAAIGRQEWCAHDMDEYVGIALELAADLTRLAAIRADLRSSVANSPLGDATGFTRNLEKAYLEMWASWCLQN